MRLISSSDAAKLEGRLPPRAVAKFNRLQQIAEDATVLSGAAFTAYEDAKRAMALAKYRLHYDHDEDGRLREKKEDEQLEADVERLTAEADQGERRYDARKQREIAARDLLKTMVKYVRGLPEGTVAREARSAPDTREQATVAAVERIRDRLAKLRADLHAAESAPIPSADAKRIVAEQINALADDGTPDFAKVLESGSPVGWPMLERQHGVHLVNTAALLAWVSRQDLIEAANAEIDALADDRSALTEAQRSQRVASIKAQILAIERTEEAMIERAAIEGAEITRRTDADPRAVLGIE